MPLQSPRIFWSLVWLVIGLGLALLSPWIGLYAPSWITETANLVPLVATAVLIAWNLAASIRLMGRAGQALPALPLTVMQFLLFTLLFFQIASHQGSDHYQMDAAPRPRDWLQFAAVHALRAGDVFDTIEAYGLRLQTIQHGSHLTAVCVIAFHLILDTFLIGMLLEWVDRGKKTLLSRLRLGRIVRAVRWSFLGLLVAAWLTSALFIRPWQRQDLLLWPIDNLIRVLDFTDALEVYHVQFHQVPKTPWEGTLTFLCRVVLAGILASVLGTLFQAISIRWLGGFGLSKETLEELCRNHPHASALQARLRKRLADIAGLDSKATRPSVGALCVLGIGLLALTGALIQLPYYPGWDRANRELAQAATGSDPATAQKALATVRRMGYVAEPCIPALVAALPQVPPDRRGAIVDTLGYLGTAAAEPLGTQLDRDADEASDLRIVHALEQIGPSAAPILARGSTSQHARIREVSEAAITKFGSEAVQPLIDSITAANVMLHLRFIKQLDPYWYRRTSPNTDFDKVVRVHELISRIQKVRKKDDPSEFRYLGETEGRVRWAIRELDWIGPLAVCAVPELEMCLSASSKEIRLLAVEALGDIGPGAADALPQLIQFFIEGDWSLSPAAGTALRQIDPNWHESDAAMRTASACLKRLADKDPMVRKAAAEAVGRLRLRAEEAVPLLVQLLMEKDPMLRKVAAETLGQIGTGAKAAVPQLTQVLRDGDQGSRMAAAEALGRIGPGAAAAVPQLAQLLSDEESKEGTEVKEELLVVVKALERIGAPASATIPQLAQLLANRDGAVRSAAESALGQIAPKWYETGEARQTVPALIRRLKEEQNDVHEAAKKTLGQIAPKWYESGEARQVIPALINRLADDRLDVRSAAAKTLEQIDPHWPQAEEVKQVIPILIKRLAEAMAKTQTAEFKGKIGSLGTTEKTTGFWLLEPMDGDADVYLALMAVLARIGPPSAEAVPKLVELLANTGQKVRRAAEKTLGQIDPHWNKTERARQAIPALIERLVGTKSIGLLLTPSAPSVRAAAARTLERIDPEWHKTDQARQTVPILTDLLEPLAGQDPSIREAAEEILRKIDPKAVKKAGKP